MSAQQPEAVRLADALEQGTYLLSAERESTASELRRLQSVNVDLLGALHYLSMQASVLAPDDAEHQIHGTLATARAAIAKATAPAIQRLPADDTEGGAA
jgi:hypothetical protein